MNESSNRWESHWGRGYDPETKERMLEPLFGRLEKEGKLGEVLVDVGSGASSVLNHLPFSSNKKEIHIDIEGENETYSGEARVRFDAEKIDDQDSVAFKRALVRISEFLGINPRTETSKEKADTVIFSEILNYVDYQKVLKGFGEYIKPGGRIIILNKPTRGIKEFFSDQGLKNNLDLFPFLKDLGFEIEYKKLPWRTSEDIDESDESDEMIILVACKKPST